MFAFVAVVAILGMMAYVYLLARSVELGVCSLLAITLFNLTLGVDTFAIGRLHISALDFVYLCLLVAGLVRFISSLRVLDIRRALAVGYLLVFASSVVHGIAANGFFAAANEARGFVGPLLALIYFSDAPIEEQSLRRYCRCYLIFGGALCGVTALASMGFPVGVVAWAHSSTAALDGRYLPATGAAITVICAFFPLGQPEIWRQLATALFLFAGAFLRHRTVWGMMLVGMIVLAFADGTLFRRILPCALLASIAIGAIILHGDRGSNLGEDAFETSVSDASTWEWRVSGWQELLAGSDADAYSMLFGQPMGGGWLRMDAKSHQMDAAPPHSEYVTQYLRVGGIGLLLISLFALLPLGILRKGFAQHAVYPGPAIWGVIAVMVLVYGITYSIEPETYALIGLANGVVSHRCTPIRELACGNFVEAEIQFSSTPVL